MRMLLPIAAALALAAPAQATIPDDACFVLATAPAAQGAVARMTLRFGRMTPRDRATGSPYRYGALAVVMAPRLQGLADGVHGKPLTQTLFCRADTMVCQASEGEARARVAAPSPDELVLTTQDLPVADYGESDLASNLAHPPGARVEFRLRRAAPADCRSL